MFGDASIPDSQRKPDTDGALLAFKIKSKIR